MARLPSEADLGGLPSANSGRPIASYDATGFARGAAAIDGGVSDVGKGIQTAGRDIAAVQQQEQTQNDQLDVAKAESFSLVRNKQLIDEAKDETDPNGLPERYTPQFQQVQTQAAALISNPRQRELWLAKNAPTVESHILSVGDHTFNLQKDQQVSSATDQLHQLQQSAVKTSDPATRSQMLDAGNHLIDGLQTSRFISATEAGRLKKTWAENYAVSAIQAMPAADQVNLLRAAPGGKDAILDRIGGVENATGNPNAKNPNSSATGNFQFIESTWLNTLKAHRPDIAQGRSDAELLSLRADPKLSREMAGHLLDENAASLRSAGVDANPSNLYLAHFLGADDAAKVLKASPGTPVQGLISQASIDANKSVLQGKTVDTVIGWAGQKMGGTAPKQAGIVDFIPYEKQQQLLAHAQDTVVAQGVDGAHAVAAREKAIKQASDDQELNVFKDMHSDNPQISAQAILDDKNLSKEAKVRMFKAKTEATAGDKADKTYGSGFYAAYQAVHAPESDPNRITDPSQLYSRVGPKGDLTVAGVDKLVTEIQGRRTPEGVAETDMKRQFLATAKGQISGSDEGLHIKDPKGDELYLRFLAQVLPAYEAGKKAGKSPVAMLDPNSSDYLGKAVDQFKRPMDQWFSDVVHDAPGSKTDATAFDPKSLKSLDELVAAYRAGKVSKEMADSLAIDNGWAKRRAAAPALVPVSQ